MYVRDEQKACTKGFRRSGFTLLEVAVAMAVQTLNETDINPNNDAATEATSINDTGTDVAVSITDAADPVTAGSGTCSASPAFSTVC